MVIWFWVCAVQYSDSNQREESFSVWRFESNMEMHISGWLKISSASGRTGKSGMFLDNEKDDEKQIRKGGIR